MKKTLTAVLCCILAAACVAGCTQTADDSDTPTATRNTGEYYSTWTAQDWENATPEERQLACIFLVEEAAATMGDDEEVVQSVVDEAEETLTPEQYEDIENAVSAYFENAGDKGNLQDSLHDVLPTISKYVAIG